MTAARDHARQVFHDWVASIRSRAIDCQRRSRDKYDEVDMLMAIGSYLPDCERRQKLWELAIWCQREAAAEADFARRFTYHYDINTR